MTLKIYNSLSRTKEDFVPIDPNHIKMYVCGPTVYSYAHIGNARPPIVFDTLKRVLSHLYPQVTHVANITDIEDKIIEAAKKAGEPISIITEKYTDIYNQDMAALGVSKPTFQPKATDHVDGMVTMIETLIANNNAYEKDGHVLFHVPSYDDYGHLSGRNREDQIAGARVEVAPYKRDPADFILWKPSTDDQPGWNSPWGRGRPGWHIECSVMAKAFLGDVFDIHGGGVDLTFPHHENEIAQSCCANDGGQFARYWIHNGFVTVEGEKMSKSIGNVLLVHDLIRDGMKGEAIRLAMLSTHYRQPFDWTASLLDQSKKTLDKWYRIINETEQQETIDEIFLSALSDDLNTPLALSHLHDIAKNRPKLLKSSASLLGILNHSFDEWFETISIDANQINDLVSQRNQARIDKDFGEADEIRDQLKEMGIDIHDGEGDTTWSKTS
jgi:cysteinyl-tRNA synthetase